MHAAGDVCANRGHEHTHHHRRSPLLHPCRLRRRRTGPSRTNACRRSTRPGAGSHALELQQLGCDVTAVEISPSAAAVIRERGVKNVICAAIADVHEGSFDTIVLLMNGFGIAGNEVGLEALLKHLKTLLAPSGSILADSTNLREWEERAILNLSDGYHGEVMFRVADGELSDEFGWIYPDEFLLEALCDELGLSFEVIAYGERGSFLCRISHAG